MNVDLNDLFNAEKNLDEKSTMALLRAMVKSHNSGFDYLKFKQSIKSLQEMDIDQSVSFKSAFTTASTLGLTKAKLIASANRYLGVLQSESESFTDALRSQIDRNVNSRETMISELEARIKTNKAKIEELQKEIEAYQNKIDNVDNDIESAQVKIDSTKERFRNSYLTITDIIKKDIELINLYSTRKRKSFWSKPEGVTGAIFLAGIVGVIAWLGFSFFGAIWGAGVLGKAALLGALGVVAFMGVDNKTRTLISYMYQNVMRKITGIFITIDPIGILKNYISDLESNLKKMGKQIGGLKGQMRKIKTMVEENNREIENNMIIAKKAKQIGQESQLVLATRKAARLKESNSKYVALHKKMTVLYKVLTKMYSNSEILLEDTKDQVRVKEQEYKAIKASNSAMKSAMSIIKGDPDKRAMFDQTMEHLADDVSNKMGEMEQFMEMSSDFMNSIDIQNGVFEEKGMKMLEEYEKKSTLLLLGGLEKNDETTLDLNEPRRDIEYRGRTDSDSNEYDGLFD